jgi:transposase InsO family protein
MARNSPTGYFSRDKQASAPHEFDRHCAVLDSEQRLTRPRTPQTNGWFEYFNGRIADILKTHHFRSGENPEQTLFRYALLYNEHLPQTALKSETPMGTMKTGYASPVLQPSSRIESPGMRQKQHPRCSRHLSRHGQSS